jgi:hypothetical protein
MGKQQFSNEEILEALSELIKEKTELKTEKIQLQSLDVLQKQIEGMKSALKMVDGRINEGEQYLKELNKYRNFSLSIFSKLKKFVSDVKMHKVAEEKLNKFEKAAKELGVKVNNVAEVKEIKKLITETEEQIKRQKTLIKKFEKAGLK